MAAPAPVSRGADDVRNVFMNAFLEPEVLSRVDALAPIASDLGLSMAQLALAWCLRQSNVASVIIGVTRASQLDDNAKASGQRLPEDVVARIEEIFPA